jgi:hypothetical protein
VQQPDSVTGRLGASESDSEAQTEEGHPTTVESPLRRGWSVAECLSRCHQLLPQPVGGLQVDTGRRCRVRGVHCPCPGRVQGNFKLLNAVPAKHHSGWCGTPAPTLQRQRGQRNCRCLRLARHNGPPSGCSKASTVCVTRCGLTEGRTHNLFTTTVTPSPATTPTQTPSHDKSIQYRGHPIR